MSLQFRHLGNLATYHILPKLARWNTSVQTVVKLLNHTELQQSHICPPPEGVLAGEIELISISIRNGDGSAEVIEQIPVRVGLSQINLASKGIG